MLKFAGAAALIIVSSVAAVKVFGDKRTAVAAPPAAQPMVGALQSQAQAASPARNSFGKAFVSMAADARGHFTADLQVNGARIRTLVDTGASVVALSAEDARRAGLYPAGADFRVPISTANGVVKAAPVRLSEVRLDAIVVRDVEAMVLPAGALQGTLLGMSFLRRLGGMEIAQGRLVLTQ